MTTHQDDLGCDCSRPAYVVGWGFVGLLAVSAGIGAVLFQWLRGVL